MRFTGLPLCLSFALTGSIQAQDYTPYIQISEGSVICRQGILGLESGPMLSYEAWLKDPRGVTVGQHNKYTYSFRLDGQYQHEEQTSGVYTCHAKFYVNSQQIAQLNAPRFINNCGDQRGNIIAEYNQEGVAFTPNCSDFTQSVPSLSHYSFSQWNSSTYGWAILKDTVVSNTYCVVANHGSTPPFSSGYRNPVRNLQVSGALNSRHVYGDAVDLDTPNAPNNTMYNALRTIAKGGSCGVACVEPRSIAPNHFHADYRGACPSGW